MTDELAKRRARRLEQAPPAPPPMTALEAITRADFLLAQLLASLEGQLLVPAEHVRDVAGEVDRILLGLRNVELGQAQ